MPKVERDVRIMLSDQNYILAHRMRDTSLVEDICVLARQVTDHDACSANQSYHVLDNRIIVPDVIGAHAIHADNLDCSPQGANHTVEPSIERHHHRDQIRADWPFGQFEYRRFSMTNAFREQHSEE